jgi:ATP-dependent RNA helicase DDX5/DBP2
MLSDFRSARCPVLVATDVAARGLDVKDTRFEPSLQLITFKPLFVNRFYTIV